jgi:lysophospholipase L1-like esterase
LSAPTNRTEPTPLPYLALGDSYTIGEGVSAAQRWPVQLARALRQQGVPLADPQIIATTGWTTDELEAGIDAAAPHGPFALVSLLVGVNNQYRGRTLENYVDEFQALLARAIGFAGQRAARVLVLSIPDWGVTPFAQGRDRDRIAIELDAFNHATAQCCAKAGVAFVDITAASRDGGDQPEMLVEDGLHPSAQMYARWTQLALPTATTLLNSPLPTV